MVFATYLFWVLMILWLVFGPDWSQRNWRFAGSLLLWLLIALLGAYTFGNPFK